MTKKYLLLTIVLGGVLLLSAPKMPAPTWSEFKSSKFIPGQDPLDTARDNKRRQDLLATRRSLTAVLSTDAEGKHPGVDFTPNDKRIFLSWHARTGSKGDQIQVRWVAEAVDGFAKDRLLSEETETLPNAGSFKSNFYLSPAKATLPSGTYRADLYKNMTLVRTLKFTVKPPSEKA